MSNSYADINNYEFQKTLGEGNFAQVKLSIFKPTGEQFAIKIINKTKLKQKMKNTLFRETEIISKLKHPNIITVYQMIEDSDNFYIIMENCPKGELFDYIVKYQNLSENEASIFFYQLINGVEYIHSQNIVHRDLKPENLLLTENKILKIIDFGLSHPFDGTEFLKTKCGSPSYAAPEIITGTEYDGFKTDIWCCGVILYAMVCGFLPFEGDNDTELFKSIIECNPEIPDELSKETKKIIRKIFTQNPNDRITIPEIKKTEFYLKGKQLFNIKYSKYSKLNEDKKNINFIKQFCTNLFEVESNEIDNKENKIENTIDNNNIITIDEENNNYEEITLASGDEEDDKDNDIINNKKGNDINIFDINKINKIKQAQTINVNKINIFNKECNDVSNENIEFNEKEKNIHLQTYGNVERTQMPKLKLKLNFNNLKNNYNNNHIFNSFRKKLIKDDLNQEIKQKYENYQKIMKTEVNEYKIPFIKIPQNKEKNENNQRPINLNQNNNYNSLNNEHIIKHKINNDKNDLNQLTIQNNKDNLITNYKSPNKNLILKLGNSNKIKNILNSYHKSKKLILGKSPNYLQKFLTNFTNKNQSTSFKRFVNNLGKISMKSITNRKKVFDNSHNSNNVKNRTNNEEIHLNTITTNKIYSHDKNKNSKSIEVQNSDNIKSKINKSLIINKKNYTSPWKYFVRKNSKNGKFSPSIGYIKSNLIKNHIINNTPKNSNLYYNNINININTINVNENRNHKLLLNEFSNKRNIKFKGNNFIHLTESNKINKSSKLNYNNNKQKGNIRINFSKLIAEVKNKKNNIYIFDKNKNNKIIAKSLGANHNNKNAGIFVLKMGHMQRNFGKNNLSKNINIRKGNPKSEEKWKQKQKL